MNESTCETCGAPLMAGGGGADPSADQRLDAHLLDFNDPHRVRDWIPRTHFGIIAPVVDASYRVGDFYFDLTTSNGYSYRDLGEGEDPRYEWRQVVAPYRGSIDLSAYLTKVEAATTYVTIDYAAAHFLTSASLSGYVTNGALASALASYATQSYVSSALSSSGFITQAFADARYQRVAAEGEQFVTASALATALAAYKPTAELANFLGVANFVTYSYANGENGYIPKSQADSLNYAKESWVTSQLSSYIPQSSLSTIQANVKTAVMGEVTPVFATKAELNAAVAGMISANGSYLLKTFRYEGEALEVFDRANNYVVMTGSGHVLPIVLPTKVPGVARDFLVVVKPETGVGVWGGGTISLDIEARSGELPVPTVVCSSEPVSGTVGPVVDTTGMGDLGSLRVLFAVTEVADGEFMVSARVLYVQGGAPAEEE